MKSRATAATFIRDLDSRAMPRYTLFEAAGYLGLPESTIRSWFVGMLYGKSPNVKWQEPVLKPAAKDLLSFFDIASAHVLMALKARGLRPNHLRDVINELRKENPGAPHPVLGQSFFMFGRDVILSRLGELLNLSRKRQLGLRAVMQKFLDRVEYDANLMPLRFSPLRTHNERGKGYIIIDPDFAYGRPIVRGTAIAAEIIAKRKESGESAAKLAKDYRISVRAVNEAVKHFPQQRAA